MIAGFERLQIYPYNEKAITDIQLFIDAYGESVNG